MDSESNRLSLDKPIKQLAVAHDIEVDLVWDKVKDALSKAYNAEVNVENTLVIKPVPESSDLLLFEKFLVVEKVTNPLLEIGLVAAQRLDKNVKLGEEVERPLYLSRFSYFAIQKVSQVIKHFINVSESKKVYKQYIDKKGTILSGTIENFDYRYFSVNIGSIFAFIPREEQNLFERLYHGDRIKFYVKDVFLNHHFGQVMGSRKCIEFLEALFALEVPEIASQVIKIKKAVREPGLRAKVALICEDSSVDPIGSCIGRGGSRIKAISQELKGEKIDIFLWDDNLKQLLINAASPVKIVNIKFLSETEVRLIVLELQYPVAVGRSGSSARLLGKITGLDVEIEVFESYIQTVDYLELNGNLTHIDLEKLEVDAQTLSKCIDPKKKQE